MHFLDFLKDHIVFLDGGMGTLLQAAGLQPGESPMEWTLTHPGEVTGIHRRYFDAGAHVVSSNTFGANLLHYSREKLAVLVEEAVAHVRQAREESSGSQPKFVALDVGPTGRLLKPYGDYDFLEAVECFAETIRLGAKAGADLIFIETMNDCYETKAALLAAKENSSLPVLVSNAYGEDGKLMTGASPAAMVAMLEGMGADAIGVNCSLGPEALAPVVEEYLAHASVPVLFEPNAGMPHVEDGRTVYDIGPEPFAASVSRLVARGVRLAGGCCGTTPEHIRAVTEACAAIAPVPVVPKEETVVSSYAAAVSFDNAPVLIGERINPTGKKRFKQALREGDMGYLLQEGLRQQEMGAHILDVNVGLPEIDEPSMLERTVCELQAVLPLPLQIDTSDPVAMERAMRLYNGKPMVNSVNGKQESMDAVFPLVRKYGGVVVALTLDEKGIPQDAQGRVDIAWRILKEAEKHGISRKDLVFDTLTMTISSEPQAGNVTLEAVERIRRELGCHTSLGVSNVSFGLPCREVLNGAFFSLALARGLSAAIMNPHSQEMRKAYYAFRALTGRDENCLDYLRQAPSLAPAAAAPGSGTAAPQAPAGQGEPAAGDSLAQAVKNGLKEQAGSLAVKLLGEGAPPMELVQKELIPALDEVGVQFEAKRVFLPQLLMSAEAAKAAFEAVKAYLREHPGQKSRPQGDFVLATVQGDIHDIGKNIVRLLMENYGFQVWDLGKDVPPEDIVEETRRRHAPLVGLSALMTTTVPAMERTIVLLREKAPWAKVVVGGAVLTEEYARQIGADFYAKDAMETVRYALAMKTPAP
ncbi:MAG: homocysteine S-methyltransferase family protein [Oligosphaeraceae bacterium]